MRVGLALTGLGLLLMAGVHSRIALVAPLLLVTVGQGLVTPTLSATVAGRAGTSQRGAALGVQQSAGGLARVVGPIAGGALFQHLGVASPYLVGAGLLAVALAVASAPSVAAAR
jgi:MFS family permease